VVKIYRTPRICSLYNNCIYQNSQERKLKVMVISLYLLDHIYISSHRDIIALHRSRIHVAFLRPFNSIQLKTVFI